MAAHCVSGYKAGGRGDGGGRARLWSTVQNRACAAIAIAGRAALRVQPPAAAPLFLALRAASHALLRAAARARASGSFMRFLALSMLMRFRPAVLHSLEQYLTMRFCVVNALPHSLQFRALSLPISLSALAAHRLH